MAVISAAPARPNHKWDTRAWTIGLIFCAIATIMQLLYFVDRLQEIGSDLALGLSGASVALIIFVFAPSLSAIARRRRLLWAYLPLASFAFSVAIGTVANRILGDPRIVQQTVEAALGAPWSLVAILVGPLITSGPVCIYRWCEDVDKRHEMAKAQEPTRQSMIAQKSGAWPPAPTGSVEESGQTLAE